MNESLQYKANKEAVDRSLQSKVNRDEMKDLELRILAAQKKTISHTVQNMLLNYLTKRKTNETEYDDGIDVPSIISAVSGDQDSKRYASLSFVISEEQRNLMKTMEQKLNIVKDEMTNRIAQETIKLNEQMRKFHTELSFSMVLAFDFVYLTV